MRGLSLLPALILACSGDPVAEPLATPPAKVEPAPAEVAPAPAQEEGEAGLPEPVGPPLLDVEVPAGIKLPTIVGGAPIPGDRPHLFVSMDGATLQGKKVLELTGGVVSPNDVGRWGILSLAETTKSMPFGNIVIFADENVSARTVTLIMMSTRSPLHRGSWHVAGRDAAGELVAVQSRQFGTGHTRGTLTLEVSKGEMTVGEQGGRGLPPPTEGVRTLDVSEIGEVAAAMHARNGGPPAVRVAAIDDVPLSRHLAAITAARRCGAAAGPDLPPGGTGCQTDVLHWRRTAHVDPRDLVQPNE